MNRFVLGATKLQMRIQGFKFKGVTVVKHPDGYEQEVVIFAHEGFPAVYGQCSAVNTILLHELAFQNDKILNYLMIHEGTHKKDLVALIYPLAVLLLLGLWFALGWVGLLVGFIAWFTLLWFVEFRAECRAIRTLGIQAVLEARQDAFAFLKPSTLALIVNDWIMHPPESLVVGICRLLHKEVH